jgi:hypothetical protein
MYIERGLVMPWSEDSLKHPVRLAGSGHEILALGLQYRRGQKYLMAFQMK